MTVLVAAPTYRGKDYALEAYLAAYRGFTYRERRLFLVDNTPGTLDYARRLRALGVEAAHVEPMPGFWDTMERCWQLIAERAHELGCRYVASIEADVICPPHTLEVLIAHVGERRVVMHGVPQHDQWRFDMWCPSLALIDAAWLHESRFSWQQSIEAFLDEAEPLRLAGELVVEHLEDAREPPWSGSGEGKVFGSGRG